MSFEQTQARVPARVRRLALFLARIEATANVVRYDSRFELDVVDAAGETVTVHHGDLLPHLTDTQKAQLKALIDSLYTKAIAEAL